jgi:Glycosyl transferase family 2/Dolichyl-phosphate-mannose-protein mannosyltransferase
MERARREGVASISAFFPCYRDEATIAEMVRRVLCAFDELGVAGDVTVVNDASPDNAAVVLERLAREEPRLRVVTHEVNRGYGGALQSGFAAATGEWVFYTDGDGQYDPGELVALVACVGDDVDVVQGHKLARSDNLARRFIGRAYHHAVSVLFGLSVRDTDCDFRLIRRSVLEQFELESTSGVICVELVRKLEAAGARFVQVGVHHYPRSSGRSVFFKPGNVAKTLVDLAWLWCRLVLWATLVSWGRALTRRRFWASAAALVGVFTVTWLTALRAPVNHADEAWFLWVAMRANHGAHLYRDVYYVSTPLAMWLMQGAVWVFGPHVAVERALAAALFSISVLLIWRVGDRVSVSRLVRGVAVLVLFVFASPVAHFASIYSMLAVTLSLAAMLVVLGALERSGRVAGRSGLLAGVLCGLAFASKPNTGLLAALAVGAVLVAHARRDRQATTTRSQFLRVVVGFCVTTGLATAPFLLAGTFGDLVGNVFTGKTDYVSAVGSPLLPGLRHLLDMLRSGGGTVGTQIVAFDALVPLAVVAVFGTALWRTRDRAAPEFVALAVFTLVGIGAAAPDFGPQHLSEAMPLLVALPVFALARARPLTWQWRISPRLVAVTVTTSLILVASVAVAADAQAPTVTPNDQVVTSALPHLGGQLISKLHQANVIHDAHELRRRTGGRVFIIEASAAQFYLTGGLSDPTPYDFPTRSDLGPGGEAGAISYVQRHHVRWLCVPHARSRHTGTTPAALDGYVRERMKLAVHLHACDLYRNHWHTHHSDHDATEPREHERT